MGYLILLTSKDENGYTHNFSGLFSKGSRSRMEVAGVTRGNDGILAEDLIPLLEKGLVELKQHPKDYLAFTNQYDSDIHTLERLLRACRENPKAVFSCDD